MMLREWARVEHEKLATQQRRAEQRRRQQAEHQRRLATMPPDQLEILRVLTDLISRVEKQAAVDELQRQQQQRKEDLIWAKGLKTLQCERGGVPSLLGLAVVRCARSLIDVSRAPVKLQLIVNGMRDWKQADAERALAQQRKMEERREEQQRLSRMTPEQREQRSIEMAVAEGACTPTTGATPHPTPLLTPPHQWSSLLFRRPRGPRRKRRTRRCARRRWRRLGRQRALRRSRRGWSGSRRGSTRSSRIRSGPS